MTIFILKKATVLIFGVTATFLYPLMAHAQCPGFSWITELHARTKSMNCRSAAREISSVFNSVVYALKSGRSVEIKNFGQFSSHLSKKNAGIKNPGSAVRRIRFKPELDLLSGPEVNPTLLHKLK